MNETPRDDCPPDLHFIQVIPGTGYVVAWLDKEKMEDGSEKVEVYLEPLTAWGLNKEGSLRPLQTDCNGFVDVVTEAKNFIAVLPDERDAAMHATRMATQKLREKQKR